MAYGCWRFAMALAVSASGGGGQPAVQESPTEQADPEQPRIAPQPRLKLDIERAITEAMARDPSLGLPRFEERVEVRDVYQESLEALLRGVDVKCGASQTGPPTTGEMNPYRGATIPPHADFLGAGKAIAKGVRKLLGSKKPRYFLYAVHRPASGSTRTASTSAPVSGAVESGDTVSYLLRESPISKNARASVPGTRWELIAGFRERDDALVALDRLRRGFATLQRAREDGRLPPWVSTTCRPPRIE